jgi:pectate lyase
VGWAAIAGSGLDTTTGGGDAAPVTVTTVDEFNAAVQGSTPAVVLLDGNITGNVGIGSNKTVIGICGAQFTGHLGIGSSSNVIVRNLRIVGYNCSDSPNDCSAGADAITVSSSAHHIWFDHDDILDGSDGNLDIVHGSDFITVSWTKFSYSSARSDPMAGASGHRFSNLIGNSDTTSAEDSGHLNVTFHHVWWADNVDQRMPRIRFGKIHVFNSLYTATNNNYAIGPGTDASVRSENNVFIGVTRPINTTSFLNDQTTWNSVGNIYTSSDEPADRGTAFSPPYSYTPDPVDTVEASVRAGAGPQ